MWKTKKNKISWYLEFNKAWKLQRVKNYKEPKIKKENQIIGIDNLSWIV